MNYIYMITSHLYFCGPTNKALNIRHSELFTVLRNDLVLIHDVKQESLANAKVSARQSWYI